MIWVSGPAPHMDVSAHECERTRDQADAGPTEGVGPACWKTTLGGWFPLWDACLTGLQPLGHYDPGQRWAWVLDCYMDTESRAPQTRKESCSKKMGTLKPTNAHSREDGDLLAWPA